MVKHAKKHAKKGHHAAHTFRYLRQPHARSALMAHQKNVITQRQFLAAQNAMQNRINETQRLSYVMNPQLR